MHTVVPSCVSFIDHLHHSATLFNDVMSRDLARWILKPLDCTATSCAVKNQTCEDFNDKQSQTPSDDEEHRTHMRWHCPNVPYCDEAIGCTRLPNSPASSLQRQTTASDMNSVADLARMHLLEPDEDGAKQHFTSPLWLSHRPEM